MSKNLKIDEQDLEPVKKNEQFLDKYQAAKDDVDKLQNSLKKYSIVLGIVGVCFTSFCLFVWYCSSKAGQSQKTLKSPNGDDLIIDFEDMHFSSMTLSVLWGLVLLKAKQGFNAANAKDTD